MRPIASDRFGFPKKRHGVSNRGNPTPELFCKGDGTAQKADSPIQKPAILNSCLRISSTGISRARTAKNGSKAATANGESCVRRNGTNLICWTLSKIELRSVTSEKSATLNRSIFSSGTRFHLLLNCRSCACHIAQYSSAPWCFVLASRR